MDSKKLIWTGVILFGFIQLVLFISLGATPTETSSSVAINSLIAGFLINSKWVTKKFIKENASNGKVVLIGFLGALFVLIIRVILGALFLPMLV
tara:strand:- start:2091 stop:2372 length:282 start_codon:yes stop_codon:yes gene_type:complete